MGEHRLARDDEGGLAAEPLPAGRVAHESPQAVIAGRQRADLGGQHADGLAAVLRSEAPGFGLGGRRRQGNDLDSGRPGLRGAGSGIEDEQRLQVLALAIGAPRVGVGVEVGHGESAHCRLGIALQIVGQQGAEQGGLACRRHADRLAE
jgi:hypothetical protein